MGKSIQVCTSLTISSGGTTSNVLSFETSADIDSLRDADAVCLYAPTALTGTISVEVSDDNSTWNTLQSGAVDVTIAVNKAVTLQDVVWPFMRLKSSLAEGAARTFRVTKLVEVSRAA